MQDKFFITTPIYYTNGIPHIGHAYSSIIADTIARYQKISGKKVKFSTGVDENSQKALQKAEEQGMDIVSYLDMMADKHRGVWDGLKIKYTDFIRTTEERHHKLVREVLQTSFDKGDIYAGEYEGMYCVGCEGFKKDEDLVYKNKSSGETFPITPKVKPSDNIIKVCPDHLTEPQKIKEKNYFFRLSAYQDKLLEYYEQNPDFVTPRDRFNEVIAFVKRGLDDFSISRETNKFGIRLPFDEEQVTYVWYDALFNYVTVCKYSPHPNHLPGGEGIEQIGGEYFENQKEFWPADLHVVGKDIIRFHAIYWPAMLLSAGYELPKQILTTGFFTVDGQKISKTLGNVIDPVEFSEKYSKDLLTLYLLSSFNIGQDGDFDQKQAILTYNAKLANNLGNLVNRVVVLSLKLTQPHPSPLLRSNFEDSRARTPVSLILKGDGIEGMLEYNNNFDTSIKKYDLKSCLDASFAFLDSLNKFADEKQPWVTIKDEDKQDETREVLYTIAEGLRQVGLSLYPFFPEKMGEMFVKLGLEDYVEKLEDGKLEELRNKKEVFNIKEKGEALFLRFDI
ncbi:MAG: methionine--tRNA ligase [Candidatus Gracilibacteria bacterium]|nr:methionine--tRNA ligase [Candidatus Gracilibacteria bacterium]